MKKVSMLMLGLMVSAASFASSDDSKESANTAAEVQTRLSVKNETAELFIEKKANTTATITLKDEQGNLIYTSKVDLKKGVRQPFDISRLESGSYEFTISTGNQQAGEVFSR